MPFDEEHKTISKVPCPKCGAPVEVTPWDSSDGAYTDYRCECTNPECDYVKWEEGADA